MTEIEKLCEEHLGEKLYQIIISNPKSNSEITKVKIRPIKVREEILFQISEWKNNQIFHNNLNKKETIEKIEGYLLNDFKQMEMNTTSLKATALISKKGKITIKKKNIVTEKKIDLSHNKVKKYILREDIKVPFLIDLGVQTKEGKIAKSHYDKFRQINRYLEFVQDIMDKLPTDREITIIDFGCGKSYLTFALYYYMNVICERRAHIIGLDLKKKVIDDCNALAVKYGYERLEFLTGDVSTYDFKKEVDMVVTLHACDTATDYAIAKAIDWQAKVIFTVPCCQHEVNSQIKNEELAPLLKYGLIKERLSSLITDGIRACLMEENGYQVQVMEFIDMEHTPKNILLRAVKDNKKRDTKIKDTADFLNISTTLQKLL